MNATSNLIRAAVGWTYPDPGACDCGERAAMQGWAFCRCLGAGGGGHPQWRCRACDRARVLGCVGAVPVANDYGGPRTGGATLSAAERRGDLGRIPVSPSPAADGAIAP